MYRYEHTQHLAAPPEVVKEFFSDARHLDSNTPPFFRITMREGEVGVPLRPGQLFHYRFHLFGVPVPWTTEITEVEPTHFVDVQRRGPYRSFRHLHIFMPWHEGTMMIEHIEPDLTLDGLRMLAARNPVPVLPRERTRLIETE